MASREMIDVLQRLKELDAKNPNVHGDALDNTEKMNGSAVTEAEFKKGDKVKVDGKETTITVPNGPGDLVGVDKDGKTDMVKSSKVKKLDESITISADSAEDLPVLQQIMKLAGMQTVTPDMMPDADNVPVMKADPTAGCGGEEHPLATKRNGMDFDIDQDGMPDITYDNSPNEHVKGTEDVTIHAGYEGENGQKAPQDLRVKDPTPYGDYEARLAKLAGITTEAVVGGNARPIDPNSVFARLGNDIQSIMNDALDGNDMADDIADELGDYLRNGDAPEGSHYEKAIQIVMSSIHDGPQAQAEAAEEALSVLHSEEKNPKFADEGYDNEPEEFYKNYDPDLADKVNHAKRKVSYKPDGSADNPLESIENNLRSEYETFKEELWNQLTADKESTNEGRGRGKKKDTKTAEGRGKLMAGRGRGKVMASRGRGKMPKEDVKTTEARGRGKGKKS